MHFNFESKGTDTFLVYELSKSEEIDSLTMGMVSNNRIEGVIPFSFSQLDEKRYLQYNVSSKISLSQYFSGIVNRKRLIGVMTSVASAIINAQDYMIEPHSFIFDRDYIFIDVSSTTAQIICLPVVIESEKNIDLEKFFKEIILGIQYDSNEDCGYVAKLIGYFNANTMFSLSDFLQTLRKMEMEDPEEIISAPSPQVPQSTPSEVPAQQQAPQQAQHSVLAESVHHMEPIMNGVGLPPQPVPGNVPMGMSVNVPVAPPGKPKKPDKPAKPAKPARKGFSFFGKKEKAPKPPKGNTSGLPGRSIAQAPNMQPPIQTDTPQPHVVQAPINPQPSNGGKGIGNSYVAPDYQKEQGSFGGTVVLNAGNKSQGTVVLNQQNAPEAMKTIPYVIRTKNQQRIPLNKDIIKFGSDASYVDFSISDNRTVSRSHADIRKRNDFFVLVDNNSTNHTFVNNNMITPNVEVKLEEGMKFKLADEEFEFHLS